MTFAGGVLTAVDEVGSSIVGTPNEGPTIGYDMTEASSNSNYVTSTWSETSAANPTGVHLAFVSQRNATADSITVIAGGTANNRYALSAIDGDPDPATGENADYDEVRINTTDYAASPTITKAQLWTGMFADTNVNIVMAENIRMANGQIRWARYGVSGGSGEIEILAFALFTDWTQRAAVEVWLRSETT